MADRRGFLAELKRRNVWRAAVLYAGVAWALSQGIAQLGPAFGMPDWGTRWFVIACVIGFPFWIAFAWFYEFTPQGFRREREVPQEAPVRHSNTRKLDLAIIGALAVAVALLASGYFIHRTAPAQAVLAKSIAVLPFENLSADKSNAYFVAGMQDLILTKLADIGGLKVIARTSTMKYASHPDDLKTIGRQLGMATLLEGSVQKQGKQVLINVQLINAHTDSHIWAQSYTRTLDNVFGVEGEVAAKIATALNAKLSPAQSARLAAAPTHNKAAYDAFLHAEFYDRKGQRNYDTASLKAAIPLYRQAIQHDPGFALAWARLSFVESMLAWEGSGGGNAKQLIQQGRADADEALKLAPNLAASQIALGYCNYWGKTDYPAALKAFGTALKLQPNDADALAAQGYVQRRIGHFDAAIASLRKAFDLDPRNSSLAYELGSTYQMASRFSDAQDWYRRALAIDPDNLNARSDYSNSILLESGDVARAWQAAQGDAPRLKRLRAGLLSGERKYRQALALLDSMPDTPGIHVFTARSTAQEYADLYRLLHDPAKARPLYQQVLAQAQKQLGNKRGIHLAFVWQRIADAELGLGHTRKGLQAIANVLAIVGKSGDYVWGPGLMRGGASLYAEAVRPDLAVPLLAKALTTPGISLDYSPVMLWLDPAWDPIRHDPRFQALLKQYAKHKPAITYPAPLETAAR